MALRGLEPNSNPLGGTDLIRKLHSDPLNWGFLIQDEQMILDYPQRVQDVSHNAWNLTDRDYDIIKNVNYGDKVKISGHLRKHNPGFVRDANNALVGIPGQTGGWIDKTNQNRSDIFIRQRNALSDGRTLSRNQSEWLLNNLTRPLRQDFIANYSPYNDIQVSITNPYTYTPYLLRKHSKKSYAKRYKKRN